MTIDRSRFALNRCIAPSASLAEFFELAREAGVSKVELRNDLKANHPIDGLDPGLVAQLIADTGIDVISINAVQRFNLPSARRGVLAELDRLLEIAQRLDCSSVVLCPNCEPSESRSKVQRIEDTVEALAAFGPRFVAAGILGYVEPLGYGYSSLPGLGEAMEAIRKSGFSCYRVLIDSFHHFVGPEDNEVYRDAISLTGLVHVSGVAEGDAREPLRDAHRGLVGPDDVIGTRDQLRKLLRLGYAGDISFEPYGYVSDESYTPPPNSALRLGMAELGRALKSSIDFLAQ